MLKLSGCALMIGRSDALGWPRLAESALSSATSGAYGFRSQRAGEYAIVAVDQSEILPQDQGRAFFERILASGQTITLAESERRAVDLRVSKLVENR